MKDQTLEDSDKRVSLNKIREWYKKTYGKLEDGDIEDDYDICNIVWKYEQDRKDLFDDLK